jgi:hypothetical protein
VSAQLDVKPLKMSDQANQVFGGQDFNGRIFSPAFLSDFLNVFGKSAHFAHPAALPSSNGGVAVDIFASLTSEVNGGERVYMSAADISFMMEQLKEPEFKIETKCGKRVTAYPALVEALLQAKANIAIYEAPEMQLYLKSRGRENVVNDDVISKSGSGPTVQKRRANLALVKA